MKIPVSFRLLLYPFALIYGIIVFIRNRLFDLKILSSVEFDIPVISVGNITAGGTGKTPHVEYLVSILKNEFKVAILSRGYMRKTRSFLLASAESKTSETGDEPLQIKQKFRDVLVAVDADRVDGIRKILDADPGINAIILDDAFQHRWIRAGYSILLIDYYRPVFDDYLLPAGLLRENPGEIKRADMIILTKTREEMDENARKEFRDKLHLKPHQLLFSTKLIYNDPVPVFPGEIDIDNLNDYNRKVILVTGIASPAPLFAHLSGKYREIVHLKFHDHKNYNESDIRMITGKFNAGDKINTILITTEKDAVKFRNFKNNPEFCKLPFYYIPIEIKFHGPEEEINFNKKIIDYVRTNIGTNQRNN